MKKLIKLTAVIVVALMAMSNIATAKESNSYLAAVSNAVAREVSAAKQNICEISGNDCKEVVTLLYEIFMEKDYPEGYTYDEFQGEDGMFDSKLRVVEPYATQLKQMNITVEHMNRYRDGGTTYLTLGDGTRIYFDNSMGKATLDDPTVTLPDGRKFTYSYAEIYVAMGEKYFGKNYQEAINLLYQIFVKEQAYNYQDNVGDENLMTNENCQVNKPYAKKLKKMKITIASVKIDPMRIGIRTTVILGDGTEVCLVKHNKGRDWDRAEITLNGFRHSISFPLPKGE